MLDLRNSGLRFSRRQSPTYGVDSLGFHDLLHPAPRRAM
jgi:hypothetical protein